MKQRLGAVLGKIKGKQFLLFLILIIGLAVLVIQVGQRQLFRGHAAGGAATVVLVPSPSPLGTLNIGSTFSVLVSLNPNGESLVGADVLLSFNQALLKVNSIQIPGTFASGQNLQTYAPTNADGTFNATSVITTANSTGTLAMSAVAFNWAGNAVTPAQTTAVPQFATITFQTLAAGSTNVKVVWTASGNTTDSNLVSITSGTPTDVISDSTPTALSSTVAVTVAATTTPTATPTLVPTVTPTRTPTPIPPTPTPTIVPTATPIPTATPTPLPTPTSVPTAGSLNFKVKFQNVISTTVNKPTLLVKVILRQGTTDVYTLNNVTVTPDAAAVYSGTIPSINPGNYDVLIQGPIHLRKKLTATPMAIAASVNTADWTATPMLAGDVTGDNTIQLSDLTGVISVWTQSSTPVTPQNQKYDLDYNGAITLGDVTGIIANWTASIVNGDQ